MMLAQAPPETGTRASGVQPWLACVVLSFAGLLIHGYHPYAEDAGIYIPAVKKQLDPSLYPGGSKFFSLPAQWSVFTKSIAESARVSHLPLTYVLLLWYITCLFFTLVACWRIAEWVFRRARRTAWGFVGCADAHHARSGMRAPVIRSLRYQQVGCDSIDPGQHFVFATGPILVLWAMLACSFRLPPAYGGDCGVALDPAAHGAQY